jgi:hypothetical protein
VELGFDVRKTFTTVMKYIKKEMGNAPNKVKAATLEGATVEKNMFAEMPDDKLAEVKFCFSPTQKQPPTHPPPPRRARTHTHTHTHTRMVRTHI